MSYIRGRVDKVVHNSESFYILAVSVFEYEDRPVRTTKVAGHFFGLSSLIPGAVLEIEGDWHKHPKYGLQLKAHGWKPWARNDADVKFFLNFCVPVFDDYKLVERLVQVHGTLLYDRLVEENIDDFSEDLLEKQAIRRASRRWSDILGVARLSDFLQAYDIGGSLVAAIHRNFGEDAESIIRDNPYRLMEVEGMSFNRANKMAVRMGIGPEDPRRTMGGVLWTIREQTKQGHLFAKRGELASLMQKLAAFASVAPFSDPNLDDSVDKAIEDLSKSGAVVLESTAVYLPSMYRYERESAQILSDLIDLESDLSIDLPDFLSKYEQANTIQFSEEQRLAVETLVDNRVLVVTGAPGTGKTTLIRAFVRLFQQLGITPLLMAPTGIAAKRLASVTETHAQTIHRALRYDGFSWGMSANCPLDTKAVIVDEFSMVDQELFYRLMDALPENVLLVMVGDDAQLPSVGPGNVLRELLACQAVPKVRLDHVFRQAETSDIVLAAHRIKRGDSPLTLPKKDDSEFRFVSTSDEGLIAELVVKMAVKLKDRNANFQVLSPKYDGVVGVNNLNEMLRDELNPDQGQPSWKLPGFKARIGDRIMVIKNNYSLNVYNGDIGKLVDITREDLVLRIHGVGRMPDSTVAIPKDQAGLMLKLAYAVTVHRCQGEEFETVIMPMVRTQGRMLQRNLFYTAITRARQKVWVLGEIDAVLRAVGNAKVLQRNTVLRTLIT